MEIFTRPGVSTARLAQFNDDPRTNGPKVRNTRLEKDGLTTTKMLRQSNWNQALLYLLTQLIGQIVRECPDKSLFGKRWKKIDWKALLKK